MHSIIDGQIATSYNVAFDFLKFLRRKPWLLEPRYAPDIMLKAHRVVDGDYEFDDGSTSWPKLSKAYAELCPDDPGKIGESQKHRALEDAIMASHVLLELVGRGIYPEEPGGKNWNSFFVCR